MVVWIKHEVVDMDETRVQRCVLCGKVICDYRFVMAMKNEDGSVPEIGGWPEGSIFQSATTNPEVTQTTEPEEGFIECSKKLSYV